MITIMFVYEACVWVHMVVGGQGYFLRVIHFFQLYMGSGNGWAISPIPKYIELLNTWMWFSMKKESRINSLKIETCPYDHIFNFTLYKIYERKKRWNKRSRDFEATHWLLTWNAHTHLCLWSTCSPRWL